MRSTGGAGGGRHAVRNLLPEEPRPNNPSRSKQKQSYSKDILVFIDNITPTPAVQCRQGKVRREAESCEPQSFGTLAWLRSFASHFVIHSCVTCSLEMDESQAVNAVAPILRLATARAQSYVEQHMKQKLYPESEGSTSYPIYKADGPSVRIFPLTGRGGGKGG